MNKNLTQAIKFLANLVSFDTVSRNSNLLLIEWVADYLKGFGAEIIQIPNDDNSKANLIAIFGPKVEGGIILSGHSDVVPIDDQDWDSNPFELIEKDGKLFGRGTCDMKGFSACILALVPLIATKDLKRPIIYALSYDEEIGCLGAPRMVDYIAQTLPKIGAVIVGEPTDMKTVSAHKGILSFIVEITGREAHSSRTDMGISAIMSAIPLLNLLSELGQKYNQPSQFQPPGTTITIGLIKGGTAVNILAHHCEFVFDIRHEPDFDIESLVKLIKQEVFLIDKKIKSIAPEGGAIIRQRSSTVGLNLDLSSKSENISRLINGDNEVLAVSYAAEAGIFQSRGMPTIICGPGSILQAHQADEYVEIEQLSKCLDYLEKIICLQCE